MDVVQGNTLLPGDPRLIDHIVCELKSQGIFDQFRKECIADVDTKPAYQNLRQRVEGSVTGFLKTQSWRPDMNKNQLREALRKNIYESGFLETGVERIVDQVVNPKINAVFLPQVEDVVYKFLGLEKPTRNSPFKNTNGPLTISTIDLLPTDLDPISPDTEILDKTLTKPEKTEPNLDDSKVDDFESPPFEPITDQNVFMQIDESSNDSKISGISGLTSHDSNLSEKDLKVGPDVTNPDSQLSKVSSNSRLSIITTDSKHTPEKMDISDDTNTSKSSTNINLFSFDPKQMPENGFANIKQEIHDELEAIRMEINGESKPETKETKEEVPEVKIEETTPEVKEEIKEEIKEVKVETKEEPETVETKDDQPEEKQETVEPKKVETKERSRTESERKRDKDKKSDKDKDKKYSSSTKSSSKDKDRHRDKTKDSRSKDKESSSSSSSSKSKTTETKDSSKSKEDKSRSSSSKHSSRDRSRTDSKSDSRSSKDNRKDPKKSSENKKESTDDSKPRKSDSKSKTSDDKTSSRSREHSKSDTSSKSSSKDRKSSSSRDHKDKKDSKDPKKSSKRDKDDHSSSREKKDNRRSADRDSNDGSSGVGNTTSGTKEPTSSSSSNKSKTSDSSDSNSGSNSGDSGQSDNHSCQPIPDDQTSPTVQNHKSPVIVETVETELILNDQNQMKIKKPKIASNIFEARKLMKIRKKLEKIEKKRQKKFELAQSNHNLELDNIDDTDSMDSGNLQIVETEDTETKTDDSKKEDTKNTSVISKESWDAIEAQLSQSVNQNVDFDSYVDENNDSSSSVKIEDGKKSKNASEDEDCLYFNTQVSPTTERFLKSVETLQKSSSVSEGPKMAPPNVERPAKRPRKANLKYNQHIDDSEIVKKTIEPKATVVGKKKQVKGKKRKIEGETNEIYSENNNKKINNSLNDIAEEFDNTRNPSPSVSSNGSIDTNPKKSTRSKKTKKNSESFPSSPDIEVSFEVKSKMADDKELTVPTRTPRGATAKNQRYSSDDLYKPRPFVSGSSRRQRGMLNSTDKK